MLLKGRNVKDMVRLRYDVHGAGRYVKSKNKALTIDGSWDRISRLQET